MWAFNIGVPKYSILSEKLFIMFNTKLINVGPMSITESRVVKSLLPETTTLLASRTPNGLSFSMLQLKTSQLK
jgi:hypothetical protein